MLYLGTADGHVSATRLSDSTTIEEILSDVNHTHSDPILTMAVAIHGVIWAGTECGLHYLMPSMGSTWNSEDFCLGEETERPVDMLVEGRRLFVATESHGIHVIDYNISASGSADPITIDRNTVWDTSDFLSGDSIADLAIANDILYIATSDSGIDRLDLSSSSWLGSWTSSNWLASDTVVGLAATPGWLHILGDEQVQAYDTDVLLFRSETSLSDFALTGSGASISAWPGDLERAPGSSMALVGDSSGTVSYTHLTLPTNREV